ncbi:toll/interleukin-1 receptor domain-containing protein [bacterium]
MPRVFISYSNDSPAHQKWVFHLATELQEKGVDVLVDPWELRTDDDIAAFFQNVLSAFDYILLICTDEYVRMGKTVITSHLMDYIDEDRIIPIIKQNGTSDVPEFLNTDFFIDFSFDDEFEESISDLLRILRGYQSELMINSVAPNEDKDDTEDSEYLEESPDAIYKGSYDIVDSPDSSDINIDSCILDEEDDIGDMEAPEEAAPESERFSESQETDEGDARMSRSTEVTLDDSDVKHDQDFIIESIKDASTIAGAGDPCKPEPTALPTETVDFAAFAPERITPDSSFILDVWAYLPGQYDEIVEMATALRREANLGRKTGIPIPRLSILTIQIEIETLEVKDPIDTVVWNGVPTNASFIINVPADIQLADYPGKASIGYNGINIAKVSFVVSVADQENPSHSNRSTSSTIPKTAFASYASENRAEVLSRIQGIKKIAPDLDIFLDVFSLRSGQDWQEKLERHVPSKDTFYLFWSKAAAQSDWVEREWRLALQRRGLTYIDPVPLDEPSVAPPPEELKKLHFSDAYLAYIKYEKLKKKMGDQIIDISDE